MNTSKLMSTITRTANKLSFAFKKHSPEILVAAGVTGVVTSTVMACKATTKVNDILDDAKSQIANVHGVLDGTIKVNAEYTEEDGKKDLAIIYTQTAVKFIKLYGPSVLLGALSITSILASNNILRKRNVALAAAYATIDNGFKEYRGRVVERFGKELDKELKYGIKAQKVEEVTVDEEGKETKTKKTINTTDGVHHYSDYARIFDCGNLGWSKDPEFNLMFLKRQEDEANRKLRQKGYLFLNDVYEMLGYDRTTAGQVVGWIYNEAIPNGDNCVDFGLFDIYSKDPKVADAKARFINGYERNVILDFNVDGIIYDKL